MKGTADQTVANEKELPGLSFSFGQQIKLMYRIFYPSVFKMVDTACVLVFYQDLSATYPIATLYVLSESDLSDYPIATLYVLFEVDLPERLPNSYMFFLRLICQTTQ